METNFGSISVNTSILGMKFVFLIFYFKGKSFQQIGSILLRNIGTVANSMSNEWFSDGITCHISSH